MDDKARKILESIIIELDRKIDSLKNDDNDLAAGIKVGINTAKATIKNHLEPLRSEREDHV